MFAPRIHPVRRIASGMMPGMIISLAVARAASGTADSFTLQTPAANLTATVSPYTNLTLATQSLSGSNWDFYATNNSGQSVFLENDGSSTNQQVVLFDPSNANAGLVSVGPASILNSLGNYQQSFPTISSAGAIAGTSTDANGNGNPWVTGPGAGVATVISQTGALNAAPYTYQPNVGGTVYYADFTIAVGGNGWTVGTAGRYGGSSSTGNSATMGQDIWLYNPNNPSAGAVIIPLISTPQYQATLWTSDLTYTNHIQQTSSVAAVNASGTVIGGSTRYNGQSSMNGFTNGVFGNDGWMYTGGAAVPKIYQIGFIGDIGSSTLSFSHDNGGPLSQFTQLAAINDAGQIAGKSSPYVSTGGTAGSIAWIYTPSANPGTATGLYFVSPTNNSFTATGYISGSYGTYQRVGLTDSTHLQSTGLDSSTVAALKQNGKAAGTSNSYGTNGAFTGTDAWYFSGVNGTASRLIAPVANPSFAYTYVTNSGGRGSSVGQMNSSGLVGGSSSRYTDSTALGQDAWVYDPSAGTAGTTFILNLAGGATSNYASSSIRYLSETGVAVGTYSTYSGTSSSTLTGTYAFAWFEDGTANGKFITLSAALTNNSLSSVMWSSLASAITVGSDGTIYGIGTNSTAQQGIFALKPAIDGDANLDGMVNVDDYLAIDRGYLTASSGWANGDFNHDGSITAADYALIDFTYKSQHPSAEADQLIATHAAEFGVAYQAAFDTLTLAAGAVPEPGSLLLLGAGMVSLLGKRRIR